MHYIFTYVCVYLGRLDCALDLRSSLFRRFVSGNVGQKLLHLPDKLFVFQKRLEKVRGEALRQVDLRPGGSFLVDDLNFRMKTRPVVHCGTRLNSMSS
jgi:hypothetical protein